MKISGSQFQQIKQVYQKNKPQSLSDSGPKKSDQLNLSREAKELTRIREILAQTPEIRTERVAQLKEAIHQGTYQINGEKIAEKMLQNRIIDKTIG